jgi:chromosome segregation ATPase
VRQEKTMEKLERERDEWKAKYIQQNKDLGCEQMDPNGTIWDYAKTLQRERDEVRKWSSKLADVGDDLRAELDEAREQRDEVEADYKCLAELLDGHDSTECRMNLVRLKEQHDSLTETFREIRNHAWQLERELTTVTAQRDRLAEALKETISGYDVVTESIPSLCSDYVHNVIDPLLAAVKGGSE